MILCAKFGYNLSRSSEEKDFKFVNAFFLFCNYLPFEKDMTLNLNQLESLHPGILCTKFVWDWPSGSGEEDENVKSLQTDGRTDKQTDDGRQVIRKAHQLSASIYSYFLYAKYQRNSKLESMLKKLTHSSAFQVTFYASYS